MLVIFGGLFAYTRLFGPIPFSVNSITTTKNDLFQTSGTGKATAVPDTAVINLGVTKTAATVSDAKNQANEVAEKLLSELKDLGISEKDIKTTNYSINPNYDFTRGSQTITGYTVSQNLEVKITPIETANKAIDAAGAAGANMVGGITFTLNDQAQKELEEKARGEAIEIAKEKAKSIAQKAGIRLGKIVNVQESTSLPPQPIPLRSLAVAEDEKATNITPGENTIAISVTLSYETL